MINEIVLPDGTKRRLGNKMPTKSFAQQWDVLGADPNVAVLIPRNEWDARLKEYDSLDHFDPFLDKCPVHDQNGVGQCNADDTTLAMEFARARQGLPYVQLSAADLYHRINGGRDEGSLLEDAMHEAMTNGVGTAATSGTLWKQGYWKGAAPAAERARFKVTKALLLPSFDHFFSAALQGFPLSNGIMWYDNFNPGQDGWLPSRGTGRPGGHAIMGFKPTKATQHGETYGVWHRQSWGPNWFPKTDNRFVVGESLMSGPVGGWWAIVEVTDEGVANVP